MTDNSNQRSKRQPSRLQRRAPSSLQINKSCDWKVAIPLLSPLAASPTAEVRLPVREDPQRHEPTAPVAAEKVVFKKWQHPAAPFCNEPGPLLPPFIHSCR